MNYDEITHHFLMDFYESLSKNPELIDTFYLPESKLIISYPNEPQKISLSNRFDLLPKGDHKIFRWNGQKNGDQIIGHSTGYIQIKIEDNENDKFYQCNEMIIYMHAPQDKNSSYPYQILYHSIHLSNMEPPPQPEPKPEPKTEPKVEQNAEQQKDNVKSGEKEEPQKAPQSEKPLQNEQPVKASEPTPTIPPPTKPTTDSKTAPANSKAVPPNPKPVPNSTQQLPKSKEEDDKNPILVDNPNNLIKSRTVLAYNLPFNVPQSSILPEFAIYGKITRYAIVKGRILIEFENPNSLTRALDDGNFYWNNRYIKIKQMENQFDS